MSQIVTPYLLYEDVDSASEFLCRAFGFRETGRAREGAHREFETPLGGVVHAGRPGSGYENPGTVGRTSIT